MKVRVYRNLHNNMWSVQYYNKLKKGWRLLAHMNEIYLENVTFKVNENGRQKVISEKRKNVHAFIEGDLNNISPNRRECIDYNLGFNVTYNPYKYDSFVIPMGKGTYEKINKAEYCYMNIEDRRVLV